MRDYNLPDRPFPRGFFEEDEDEDIVSRREMEEENRWDEIQWERQKERERVKGER